jgi:thioredoxin-like negative regulator of GroEL
MGPKELNNHAVTQFNQGRIDVALEAFTQAFRIMPKNASIALNLMQCLLDKNQRAENTINTPLLKKCFELLNNVDLDADQKERLGKLKVTCDELGLSID